MTTWADHFNTYDEACEFFGVDTPAQCEAEAVYHAIQDNIDWQDDLEIRGPQVWIAAVWLDDAF